MKNAIPILWRYLLVVAISCGLAFYVSQSRVNAGAVSTTSVKQRMIDTAILGTAIKSSLAERQMLKPMSQPPTLQTQSQYRY
jgi:hypothetical protein